MHRNRCARPSAWVGVVCVALGLLWGVPGWAFMTHRISNWVTFASATVVVQRPLGALAEELPQAIGKLVESRLADRGEEVVWQRGSTDWEWISRQAGLSLAKSGWIIRRQPDDGAHRGGCLYLVLQQEPGAGGTKVQLQIEEGYVVKGPEGDVPGGYAFTAKPARPLAEGAAPFIPFTQDDVTALFGDDAQ